MPAPVFAPPHPIGVFQVLKTAYRAYLASGNAISIDVTTPPSQLATAATTVAGTVWADKDIPLPLTVTVTVSIGGVLKGTRTANVDQTTGVYTTTFPANTLTAGTASATVSSISPAETTTSGNFTVT